MNSLRASNRRCVAGPTILLIGRVTGQKILAGRLLTRCLEKPADQHCRLVHRDVKIIVNDLAGGIDDDLPGGAARAIGLHDEWRLVGFLISGGVRHGDREAVLQLIGAELVPGIRAVALEHGLDGQEYDPVVVLEDRP